MRKLFNLIKSRNDILDNDLKIIHNDLHEIFKKKILSAGVLQPGYFNDFYPILEFYKNQKVINSYHISEEEYVDDGEFYKVPVIDIIRQNEQSNNRIFLSPL
jgi:hypothetical protein